MRGPSAQGLITAREISQAMEITERAVRKRAASENWESKTGKNRTKLFLKDQLPDDVRIFIMTKTEKQIVPTAGPLTAASESTSGPGLCQRQINTALAKADLLRIYLARIKSAGWGKKEKARIEFMAAYNSGIAYPQLFEALGKVHWKTIEGWKQTVRQGDTLTLADGRGYNKRGSRALSEEQKDTLLRCALHPNKPLVSEAIRMARAVMNTQGIQNGHSDATYRRWLMDWESKNFDIWTFSREGAKAWNDKCAMYIERDYSLINVGDILVADGHVLNFEILNPWTGKPKRMTLIVWKDMKSNYPLGWEIMPTENTQAIASALRWAILRLGKYPKVAYLDNGKAFRARFFESCPDFEQAGFSGLFERLGMKTIFAWPYHGQSKTVERFFGSFAELERWCPTYVGTSIDKKPPRMNRGEKLHRKVYDKMMAGRCLTMAQAHRAIAIWFDEYAKRPQRGHLKGRAPIELYLEEKGPGIDSVELQYLMMSMEIRRINRNGISFLGKNYYDPELYGRRHPVLVRYDLQKNDSLLIFENDGTFLCEAFETEKAHPAASILGTDKDRERLERLIEHKRHQEKDASVLARTFLEKEILPEHRRMLTSMGIDPENSQPEIVAEKQPAKLTARDEQKIIAEVKQLKKINTESAADQLRKQLEEMSEMDRYEKLLEMEVKGELVPKQWQAFMHYFEMTPEYERHAEYFDAHRTKMALVYQVNANGNR